jgi:hypothetical protein
MDRPLHLHVPIISAASKQSARTTSSSSSSTTTTPPTTTTAAAATSSRTFLRMTQNTGIDRLYNPADPSRGQGGTATISQEIFNLVKGIVGAGVLTLPGKLKKK